MIRRGRIESSVAADANDDFAVNPCPHRPPWASGRFANGHGLFPIASIRRRMVIDLVPVPTRRLHGQMDCFQVPSHDSLKHLETLGSTTLFESLQHWTNYAGITAAEAGY